MKKIFLFYWLVFVLFGFLKAQSPIYEFSYDASGNRIRRASVILSRKEGVTAGAVEGGPAGGIPFFGSSVTLYPNPTRGTVRVETAGPLSIGGYRLYDGRGVLLEEGRGGSNTLTLDLSGRADGVYLLDAWVGAERRHFKVVKR